MVAVVVAVVAVSLLHPCGSVCVTMAVNGEHVVQHAAKEAGLSKRRNLRHPEFPSQHDGQVSRAPAVLLHEETSRLVGTHTDREAKRQLFHL